MISTLFSCLTVVTLLVISSNAQRFMSGLQIRQPSNNGRNNTESVPGTSEKSRQHDEMIKGAFAEMNLGKDLFEGDIKLTQQQRDYIQDSHRDDVLQVRALVKGTQKLWPDKVVPYVVDDNLREESKSFISSAIKEWKDKTCVQLREKQDGDTDYIKFVYDGGCSSYVGRIGGKQTISVGSDSGTTCQHGNIVHEIAHSLGYFHEHSRPDRDEYIEVKWDNVMPGYQNNFLKETLEDVDSRGVAYDYGSVMHYGEFFFSTDSSNKKTITPIQSDEAQGVDIGQRIGLSESDVEQAKILYNCDGGFNNDRFSSYGDITLRRKVKNPTHKNEKTTTKKSNIKATSPLKRALKKYISKITKRKQIPKLNKRVNTSHHHTKASHHHTKASHHHTKANNANNKAAATTKITELKDNTLKKEEVTTNNRASYGSIQDTTYGETNTDSDAQEAIDANIALNEEAIGEENFGKNFFEGDMILLEDQRQYLESLKDKYDTNTVKRALIKNETYLWKDRTLYYYFDEGVDDIGRTRARAAIQHWQDKTCLRFIETNAQKDYVKFVFEGGCASRVGRVGGMQKLTIGSTKLRCRKGNIIHELGHALGFFHEHSRPDRDKYVTVMDKNILPGFGSNFYKFSTRFIDSLNVPYDYDSIMHYGREFFSKFSVLLPTLVTRSNEKLDGSQPKIGQRNKLSKMDILQANLLYRCDGHKKLTNDEREKLETDLSDQISNAYVPCADSYNQESCQSIKNMGYCERFPLTMKDTCGVTCNLCYATGPQQIFLPNYFGKKSVLSKLKLKPQKEGKASKSIVLEHGNN